MKTIFMFAITLALLSPSLSFGQGEGSIRQAEQNLFIRGRLNQELQFSVTGKLTDQCRVLLPNGALFAEQTLAQLRNSQFCVESFQNSGGNYTLRLRFIGNPMFNGGRVVLRRSGSGVIDSDPIVLR